MDSFVCCNPIHVDDEQIDMQLEEVWELQRQRSKGGRGAKPAGRLSLLRGNKNRRGFSLSRNKGSQSNRSNQAKNGSMPIMNRGRRAMSAGRGGFVDDDDGFEQKPIRRSRSPWGRKNRQVSINKHVEKIETKPSRTGSRGRPASRGLPTTRGRTRNMGSSIEPWGRSRSWSLGRRKQPSERSVGIVRVRSRSQEKKLHRRQQELQRKQQQQRYEDSSEEDSVYRPPRRGILSVFKRRDSRNDEWSSSDGSYEESVREAGGFFSAFR